MQYHACLQPKNTRRVSQEKCEKKMEIFFPILLYIHILKIQFGPIGEHVGVG
jgi:hypothetical protein